LDDDYDWYANHGEDGYVLECAREAVTEAAPDAPPDVVVIAAEWLADSGFTYDGCEGEDGEPEAWPVFEMPVAVALRAGFREQGWQVMARPHTKARRPRRRFHAAHRRLRRRRTARAHGPPGRPGRSTDDDPSEGPVAAPFGAFRSARVYSRERPRRPA